jgi:hypothetical protein
LHYSNPAQITLLPYSLSLPKSSVHFLLPFGARRVSLVYNDDLETPKAMVFEDHNHYVTTSLYIRTMQFEQTNKNTFLLWDQRACSNLESLEDAHSP